MRWVQLRASTEQVECSPYYSTFHVSLLTTSLTTFTYSHIMSLTHSCLLCHLILPHISYHLPLTKISLISHKHFKQFIIFLFVTLATIYSFITHICSSKCNKFIQTNGAVASHGHIIKCHILW